MTAPTIIRTTHPKADSDQYAGEHPAVGPNGQAFRVDYWDAEQSRAVNDLRGSPPPGHPARVKAGWYWRNAPDAIAASRGPYTSSRAAWGAAMGKPSNWHARPARRQQKES